MSLINRTPEPAEPTQQDVIAGLRELADFLEKHPELPVRRFHPFVFAHSPSGKEATDALRQAAEILGPDTELKQDQYYVDVRRNFGAVELTYRCSLRDVSEERTVTKAVTERVVPALGDRQPAAV